MKKKLLLIVTLLVTLFVSISGVSSATSTISFTNRELSGVKANTRPLYTNYKQLKSGNLTYVAYCLNFGLKSPVSGSTLSLKEEITNAGLAYIFANGYGYNWNTTLLGNNLTNDEKYFATQLAIWIYQGQVSTSNLNKSDKAVSAAITLANAGKNNNRAVAPSISIAKSTPNFYLSGNFYRTDYMTVSGNGYDNYKVTLINSGADARIVTSSGQVYKSGTSLPKGTKFYIQIPSSKVNIAMNVIVRVDATATTNKIYRYDSSISGQQTVGVLMPEKKSVSAQTNFSISAPKGSLRIEKVDATTGRLIAGASIRVTDARGNLIATFTSTTQPYVINNLPLGTYTVTELSAPNGYEKTSVSAQATISANKTTTIVVKNTPVKKSSVRISKKDISTGREVAGATLVVRNSSGKVIERFVSTTTPHLISNLEEGTYTLTEEKAPAGYQLSSEVVRFTVRNGGSVQSISMYNTPKSYGVTIIKRDSATNEPLKGATLVLKNNRGQVVDSWVTTTSAHQIKNLSAGVYSVTETEAPKGYVLDSKPVYFTVTEDGQTDRVITMYNTPKSYGIGIIKKDAATNEPLAGATLVLKDSTGKVVDSWVTTTAIHYIKNLKVGEYTITETSAPAGYQLSKEVIRFTVTKENDSDRVITFYNTKEQDKTVKISKQDATTKKELPGAALTLKDANGNVIASWISGDTPHYVVGLKPGTYTLIETKSPKGYGLSDEVVTFTVNSDGKVDKEVVMYNSPIPVTDDTNMNLVYMGFIVTISLAIFGVYKLGKQN